MSKRKPLGGREPESLLSVQAKKQKLNPFDQFQRTNQPKFNQRNANQKNTDNKKKDQKNNPNSQNKKQEETRNRHFQQKQNQPAQKPVKIDMRRNVVHEYEQIHKKNRFIDRRIGENDTSLEPEDKLLMRYQKEFQKRNPRGKSLFNLNEDGDEYRPQNNNLAGIEQLTHHGNPLNFDDYKDTDHFDDDDDYQNDLLAGELHFGGGDIDRMDDEGPNDPDNPHQKTRKEVIEEIIAKSKYFKAEKAKERMQQDQLIDKLDQDFDEIRQHLTLRSQRNHSRNDDRNDNKDESDEFDRTVRELGLELRVVASERLKTPEERAQEAAEQLQRLERERQNKEKKEKDRENEKERKKIGIQRGITIERSADALSDEEREDEVKAIEYKITPQGPILIQHNRDEDDDNDNQNDDDDDDESKRQNRKMRKMLVESALLKDGPNQGPMGTSGVREGQGGSGVVGVGGAGQVGTGQVGTGGQGAGIGEDPSVRIENYYAHIPFTFQAPRDFSEFLGYMNIATEGNIEQQKVILQRICTCTHISLHPQNKQKLQKLYRIILQYIEYLCDPKIQKKYKRQNSQQKAQNGGTESTEKEEQENEDEKDSDNLDSDEEKEEEEEEEEEEEDKEEEEEEEDENEEDDEDYFSKERGRERIERIEGCSRALFIIAMQIPALVETVWKKKIHSLRSALLSTQRNDTEDLQRKRSLSKFVLLFRIVCQVFPVTELRHAIISPVTLTMCQYLNFLTTANSSPTSQILALFISTMILDIAQGNKEVRYYPEVIKFLNTILNSSTLLQSLSNLVQQNHQKEKKKNQKPEEQALDFEPLDFWFMDLSPTNQIFSTPAFLGKVIYCVSRLIGQSICIYRSLDAFPEIFDNLLSSLNHLKSLLSSLPIFQKHLKEVERQIEEIERHSETYTFRTPLELHRFKPQPLKQFTPRFDEHFRPDKQPGADRQQAQLKKLTKQTKKEFRGAVRELKKDNYYLYQRTYQQEAEQQQERQRKYKEVMRDLELQQRDINLLNRPQRKRDKETFAE